VRNLSSPAERNDLDRRLGPVEAFSLVIGRIIGSGIFRTPAPIMALTGALAPFFGVWIIAGAATLLGAFCFAELVAMLPRSGGPYVYLRAAYGPTWAFLRGWAMFAVSETAAIAAVALVCAEYSNSLWALAAGQPFSRPVEVVFALAVIWSLTAVNCRGVGAGGKLQNVFSLLKLLAVGAVIAAGLGRVGHAAGFGGGAAWWPERLDWAGALAMGAALRYAFFAYSGWEGATYVAEEVRNPERNLPRSILLGISGVLLLYLAANAAYLNQLSVAEVAGAKWVAADAMRAALGTAGAALVAAAVVLNTFGNVSAQVLVKARTWHAMGRDGLFPAALGRVNERSRAPVAALVAQAIWASVLLVVAGYAANAYESIIDYFTFTSSVFNISTFAAVWVLRRKLPDLPRPVRAWGYPYSLIVVLVIQVWLMVSALITAPVPSLLGVGLTATGLAYHLGTRRRASRTRGA
jgi:basic amino acid/polyamine antiporter, APA family